MRIRWTPRATRQLACSALAAALAVPAPVLPQPVQLRLAKSLCTSMTSQVLTSQLVPPLQSVARAEASVNAAITARLEDQRQAWFQRLDAIQPFKGVYATGQADHSFMENHGGRYSFGLEWELFDGGRQESRRQLERLKLDDKMQYLQVLRDMEQRQLQENLLAIGQMRTRLLALLYEREAAAIAPVLARHRQAAAANRMTRAELAEMEYKAERARLRAAHYAATRDVLVYPQALELVNRIESLQLRPDAELLERAITRSPEYQLQDLLAARDEFLPSAKDNQSVRLFVERSKDYDRGPHNVAGVRWRIPLGKDVGRREAQEASRVLYKQQQDSLRAAMAQKLALLGERLRLAQNEMRLLQAENRMLRTKAEVACYRLDFPVTSVGSDAEREVEELVLQLHEKQREILSARLDVLEVLTQVSALVKPKEPGELYSLTAQ